MKMMALEARHSLQSPTTLSRVLTREARPSLPMPTTLFDGGLDAAHVAAKRELHPFTTL